MHVTMMTILGMAVFAASRSESAGEPLHWAVEWQLIQAHTLRLVAPNQIANQTLSEHMGHSIELRRCTTSPQCVRHISQRTGASLIL